MRMHAVHIFDETNLKTVNDVMDAIFLLQNESVGFLNDFDLPYI